MFVSHKRGMVTMGVVGKTGAAELVIYISPLNLRLLHHVSWRLLLDTVSDS